jgi:uncharacterized protein YijF (DUF1287 family)/poly(3-hydroxybutyrate) depolymerase
MALRAAALALVLLWPLTARAHDPGADAIVRSALKQVGVTRTYDPAYVPLRYPGGDVPADRGVCTDVVVRALRPLGLDLQKAVHEDVLRAPAPYHRIKRVDASIDHRRVPNQMTYFSRRGVGLPVGKDPARFRPGDVVAWQLSDGRLHVGVVASELSRRWDGGRRIVHNYGSGAVVEDRLLEWKVIGHYRPARLLPAVSRPAAAAAAPAAAPAFAASVLRDRPCRGCLAQLPAGDPQAARRVVVLLHGDGGSPASLFRRWQAVARRHQLVLLAPACPRQLGCTAGSFWQWDGDPSWVMEQVEGLAAPAAQAGVVLDRRRILVVGWSGGASYLGHVADRWPDAFTAVALIGGGMPAATARCPGHRAPVVYVAGDRNPYHALAVQTRDALRACGHRVDWRLLPGQGHAGEWRALEPGRILDALERASGFAPAG